MFQTKYAQKINTHLLFSVILSQTHVVYEIVWKIFVQPDRPQMTIWRMRFACWIQKVTNTLSEYVILIALSRQQWLRERHAVLHYTYIALLVTFTFVLS